MTKKKYKRLPGKKIGFFAVPSRLWEGEDHILSIAGVVVSELYKRFYYEDIQAIIIAQTQAGNILSVIFGLIGVIFSVGAVFVSKYIWILSGMFFAFMLINLLLGQTCICYIRTAVQTEQLQSITRIRTARKFVRRIEPIINKAQGK